MAGTPDEHVGTAPAGTPDSGIAGPFAGRTGRTIDDVGLIQVSAPNLLSEAADRADVEEDLNDLRDRLNEALAALRDAGLIAG